MNHDEAREILYDSPKDMTMPAEAFDRAAAAVRAGEMPLAALSDDGLQIVMGGETIGWDGRPLADPLPTIRFYREEEA